MNNNLTKDSPRKLGPFCRGSSSVLVLLCICLVFDLVLNGDGEDLMLCFAPLFSGLKGLQDKLSKGLNKFSGLVKDGTVNDLLDKKFEKIGDKIGDKLDNTLDKVLNVDEAFERRMKEKEEEREGREREKERREREEEEEEERREREEERREKEEEEREERKRKWEEKMGCTWEEYILAKYERGEELTPKEKFAVELLLENEEIRAEQKRSDAEYEAKMAAEKEEKKKKRKEMISKVGGAITGFVFNSSSSSNSASTNSQRNSTPQKTVRKVWTMRYIGQGRSDAPEYLQVPSAQQYGRPSRDEIIDALMAIGYDRNTATGVANGGSTSTWEVVG